MQVGNVSEVKARIVRGEVSGEYKKKKTRRGVMEYCQCAVGEETGFCAGRRKSDSAVRLESRVFPSWCLKAGWEHPGTEEKIAGPQTTTPGMTSLLCGVLRIGRGMRG